MSILRALIQIYILGVILAILYLVFIRDVPFADSIVPGLIWPKTVVDLIQAPGPG